MSGRRLVAYVFVRDEHGRSRRFGPHDDVPGWAAEKIRNPRAWPADEEPDEQQDDDDQEAGVTGTPDNGGATAGDEGQAPAAPTEEAESAGSSEQSDPSDTVEPVQPVEVHEQPDPPAAPAAVEPPPRSGRGSGAPVWAKYAGDHGVQVGQHDSREDIIAALEAAGVRTD
jgi:hypothetical protein